MQLQEIKSNEINEKNSCFFYSLSLEVILRVDNLGRKLAVKRCDCDFLALKQRIFKSKLNNLKSN